jgi:hypothetical protein
MEKNLRLKLNLEKLLRLDRIISRVMYFSVGIWVGIDVLAPYIEKAGSMIYLPVVFTPLVGACIKVVIHHYRQKLRKAEEQ